MKCSDNSAATYRFVRFWLVLMFPILLGGCMHTDSKPVQFYRLTADSGISSVPSIGVKGTAIGPMIGLGPIHIAEYLNRPQMVIAVTANQYRLCEDHRWAERLDQNISLALFKVLPGMIGTDRIVRYPWPQRQEIDYQIGIDIVEFDIDESGQSRLTAQWFIKRKDQTTINKRSNYQFPASTTDYGVMVKAQSQCLTKLSKEIAETLRRIR